MYANIISYKEVNGETKIEELASKGKAYLVIEQSSAEDSSWSGSITPVSLRRNEREEWDSSDSVWSK